MAWEICATNFELSGSPFTHGLRYAANGRNQDYTPTADGLTIYLPSKSLLARTLSHCFFSTLDHLHTERTLICQRLGHSG